MQSMIVPLAYKYVALTLILAEVNFCAGRLHLPVNLPIQEQDLRQEAVFPPHIIGFAGRVDTEQYSFSFAKSGRLRFITKLGDGRGDKTAHEYLEGLSRIKSNINTNEAYCLATNWLIAIDVDLTRLEREHPAAVKQQTYVARVSGGTVSKEVLLPLFDVRWGDWNTPVVDVEISGDGKLLKLRQEDDSYSRRPAALIKNMDTLLAITDREFSRYSSVEQSNLVVRFSAVAWPGAER